MPPSTQFLDPRCRLGPYRSPLLSCPPHDGSPPQLGEGCSLPQEIIVEEQDPLLHRWGQGDRSKRRRTSPSGADGELGAGWCAHLRVEAGGGGTLHLGEMRRLRWPSGASVTKSLEQAEACWEATR